MKKWRYEIETLYVKKLRKKMPNQSTVIFLSLALQLLSLLFLQTPHNSNETAISRSNIMIHARCTTYYNACSFYVYLFDYVQLCIFLNAWNTLDQNHDLKTQEGNYYPGHFSVQDFSPKLFLTFSPSRWEKKEGKILKHTKADWARFKKMGASVPSVLTREEQKKSKENIQDRYVYSRMLGATITDNDSILTVAPRFCSKARSLFFYGRTDTVCPYSCVRRLPFLLLREIYVGIFLRDPLWQPESIF